MGSAGAQTASDPGDLDDMLRVSALPQEVILEDIAQQIGLPAASDVRDDLDLSVAHPGFEPF